MLKKYLLIIYLILISFNLSADVNLTSHIYKIELGDLDRVIKNRYMRVLTTKNPFDFYMSNGEVKGMQYEMMKEFVNHLNEKYLKDKKPKIVFEMIPVDFDQLVPMLKKGQGDIIAVGMTKTKARMGEVIFTEAYQSVDDAIVTRRELRSEFIKGQTIHVPKDSSYYFELRKHPDLKVVPINPNLSADNILELVSRRKYNYTVMNSYWANTLSKRFPNLIVLKKNPFRKNVELSWATRPESKKLLAELNQFLPKVKKGTLLGNTLNQKYYEDLGRVQSNVFNLNKSIISQYDYFIKKYSFFYKYDWRLMSAVALQESRFNQDRESSFGALGVFQIKQSTASEPYINIPEIQGARNAENNIHAGIKYIHWIGQTYFKDPKIKPNDRLRFALASYNAGPKRVRDAITKAKALKLNPHVWFRNVEFAMLEIGFNEPVIYVSEINKHYVSYILLGIK